MFLHSLISEGCESSSSTIIMMPLSLTLPVKWNIKQKLFICITFNKLGEVSQLLPRLKDTAAAALMALLEALQPLHVDAQVQARYRPKARLRCSDGSSRLAVQQQPSPLWPCDRATPLPTSPRPAAHHSPPLLYDPFNVLVNLVC